MLNHKDDLLHLRSAPNNDNEKDTKIFSNKDKFVVDNRENFINDVESQVEERRAPVSPINNFTRNSTSTDSLGKISLSEIAEEIQGRQHKESSLSSLAIVPPESVKSVRKGPQINLGFENMSLSNFKFLQGDFVGQNSKDAVGMKRDPSSSSIIQMRDHQTESPVQTGRNFKKTSTFLISPKDIRSSNQGEDSLRITLVDKPNVPELFIEFDSLCLNQATNKYYWVEKSRWLKFEEDYNRDSRRFDSPHLSPVSVKGVSNFRKLFSKGEAVLDCQPDKFIDVLNNISDSIIKAGTFTDKEMSEIRNALVLKHHHAGEKLKSFSCDASMYRFDKENQRFQERAEIQTNNKRGATSFCTLDSFQRKLNHVKLGRRLEVGTESLSVQVGALDSLEHTFSLFVRLNTPIIADGLNEVNCPLRFIFIVFGPKSMEEQLLEIGRVFSVMMSNLEFREVGYSANSKEEFLEATKAFVTHSVLVPLNKMITADCLAAMLPQMKQYFNDFVSEQNQKVFEDMKKEISNKNQDVSINQMENGLRRRVSVNSRILAQSQWTDRGTVDKSSMAISTPTTKEEPKVIQTASVHGQFCPPFRHFFNDWKGLRSRYLSDYKDAFTKDNAPIVFIGMIFIYFVVMAPAITFGALLNAINPMMTVTMMFLASGFFQLFYSLFGGQPFEIVGITGPIFAVEKVLGAMAISMAMDLGAMRFWIGVYVALLGVFFTAFNGVVIIKHIRRSVEEIYNFLVSAIFILSALFNMFKALPNTMTQPNGDNIDVILEERKKFGIGGATLFLAFFMANFCLFLVEIKKGSFLRRRIRNLLGSLNVPLGILLVIVMERIFFQSYSLPKLNVPPSNVVNFSLWYNVPSWNSTMSMSMAAHAICFAISLSLFSILTCEISTNSILSTKSERKLLKPSLYSINYFYILVVFPLISAVLGWPFVSGAPVRSHAHCMAMSIWSVNVPGVPAKVTGAVEQRVSGIFVGSMVFLSVFLGSALQYIPMAAMYGMFLYMGIMGTVDLIFIHRLINILQRRKYWGAHDFLRDYPTWNIMTLVLVQILFVAVLMVLNCISEFTTISWTPLLFPVTIALFAIVRGYVLPMWPKLNTHLSKMDKKHQIKLYGDHREVEQVLLTVDEYGANMKVVQSKTVNDVDQDTKSDSESENYSKLERDLW